METLFEQWMGNVPEWLEPVLRQEYLGNRPLRWIAAALVLILAYTALRLIRRLVSKRLRRMAERSEFQLDDLAADLVESTRSLVLLVAALFLASTVVELSPDVDLALLRIFTVALFLQAGIWASHVLSYALRRYLERRAEGEQEEPGRSAITSLFRFFGQLFIWSIVTLLALDNLGFDVTTLIAGLGIGGVAVALALQNVLGDTLAALSIALDKPFQVGDFLVVGDHAGSVEKIGIKTTRLRSLHGEQLVFGNGDLLSSRLRNFKRMEERRILFSFGVLYDTPLEELERIPETVRQIIESIDETRFERAHFKGFGDSSLDFEVVYHVLRPDYALYMDIQQTINLRLLRALREAGVDFAFPTRTLLLRNDEDVLGVAVRGAEPGPDPAPPGGGSPQVSPPGS